MDPSVLPTRPSPMWSDRVLNPSGPSREIPARGCESVVVVRSVVVMVVAGAAVVVVVVVVAAVAVAVAVAAAMVVAVAAVVAVDI
jgi:hypothetical protein